MPEQGPDVIVVGAGAAGICCAAELVLQGLRPLLIAESKEVGYHFRPMVMKHGRVPLQFLTRNLYGEGGWWYALAKRLEIPVRLHPAAATFASTRLGSGELKESQPILSATGLAERLVAGAADPSSVNRDALHRVLHTALTMSPEELSGLSEVSLAEWVDKVGGDELVTSLCLGLASSSSYLTRDQAERYISVFGAFSRLRGYFFGEAVLCAIEPDARAGLFVPLGQAIEQRGATVWRGRRASRVLVEGGRAVGVVMEDGTEARAPMVAVAAGTARVASLFPDAVPSEVGAVEDFERALGDYREYFSVSIVDRKMIPAGLLGITTSSDQGTRIQSDFSITAAAPWCTPSGWETIGTELVRPTEQVNADGGPDALFERMREVTESALRGFTEATVERANESHPSFISPFLCGPKLPRSSLSLAGLWYVGEGSAPVDGVYAEGAASAGVLGARAIATSG
jgi:glycine/D-amino acid oxidase-like deaminating enzyme